MTASHKKKSAFAVCFAAAALAVLSLCLAGCGADDRSQYHPYYNQQGQLRNDPTTHNPALQGKGRPNYLQYGSGKKTDREFSRDRLRQ
ncbi:hypothetical protein [Paenibacillus thermotolerans]|uniref:hypothetical protein n=1 Tax=Paenibacillus thermotolerans TaxID=3027807 RepID=UPI00236786CD|nr:MULTISPECIES: hypothetical protein [unclassified Paenibacillus]